MMVIIIFCFAIHAKLNDGKTIPNGICLNNVCFSNICSKLCPMCIPIVKYNVLNTKCFLWTKEWVIIYGACGQVSCNWASLGR
jgi:hypothetical protein